MATDIRLTIRETAGSIQRQYGGRLVPDWKLRRIVDVLESLGSLDVQRVGTYRTIDSGDIGILATELQRLGLLDKSGIDGNAIQPSALSIHSEQV